MSSARACLVLGMLLTAGGAVAQEHPMKAMFPDTDTCYARTYTQEHLKAHPRQRVATMQLVSPFAFASPESQYRLGLRYTLKGNRDRFGAISVSCAGEADGTLACSIEGDMGRFRLSRGTGGSLVVTIERMEVEGQNDFSPDLGKGGDDRVIVLHKAPMKACPKNTQDEE